jgi:hypothetical protein
VSFIIPAFASIYFDHAVCYFEIAGDATVFEDV